MKKTTLIFNAIVILALLALAWLHFRTEKIAYVDTNVLMQKYEGMKKARADFEKVSASYQSKVDTLIKDWESELRSFEKERSGLSKKELELKQQVLANKQTQIEKYRGAIKQKIDEEQQKLSQSALNNINDFITEYGKKNGYQYILGANGTGNILYAAKKNEITEIILEGLNKEYKK